METKWISVKDRLPEIDKKVLAFYTLSETNKGKPTGKVFEYMIICRIESITDYGGGKISVSWIDDEYNAINPTFWCYLPEPPKQ